MKDEKGVLGLPMRMVVAIVIGGAVLGIIIYYLTGQCFFPQTLQVSWQPTVIKEGEQKIEVIVKDENGDAIKNAVVTITGLKTADSNKTGSNGKAYLEINPVLPSYRNEGYLDIKVTAGGCYKKFVQEDAIKVIKT